MKAKVTVTITRVVDLNDHYDDHLSTDERLKAEVSYADDLFHEWCDASDVQWETKGELLPQALEATESPSEAAAES